MPETGSILEMKDINKVVLAYSGGLDTSVILKWLEETYDCEVVTFTADVGQGEREEVNAVPAGTPGGLNFGWNACEGTRDFGGTCASISLTVPETAVVSAWKWVASPSIPGLSYLPRTIRQAWLKNLICGNLR